jgi:sulfite exporter TauE/SafE
MGTPAKIARIDSHNTSIFAGGVHCFGICSKKSVALIQALFRIKNRAPSLTKAMQILYMRLVSIDI